MATDHAWRRVAINDEVSLSLPSGTHPVDVQGIDSAVAGWTGDGVQLSTDSGPFADRLDQYDGEDVELDGHPARLVSFDDGEARVVAAHLTDLLLTITVRTDRIEGETMARQILSSISTSTSTSE